MKEITLDAARLTERESAQEYLKERFGFPDYYGKNLDALHDMLCELADTRVTVRSPKLLNEKYGYGKRIFRVLTDAALENPGLTLVIGESGPTDIAP